MKRFGVTAARHRGPSGSGWVEVDEPAGGIGALDTASLRMTFPSRLHVRLRDGSTRLVEGKPALAPH